MGPIKNYYVIPGIRKIEIKKLAIIERKSQMELEAKRVCKAFDVDYGEFIKNMSKRHRDYVLPRQVSMMLFVKKHQLSLAESGAFFNKDHSTVIHACRTVSDLYSYDTEFQKTIKPLIGDIKL